MELRLILVVIQESLPRFVGETSDKERLKLKLSICFLAVRTAKKHFLKSISYFFLASFPDKSGQALLNDNAGCFSFILKFLILYCGL